MIAGNGPSPEGRYICPTILRPLLLKDTPRTFTPRELLQMTNKEEIIKIDIIINKILLFNW